jgi:hypothetical protein
VAGRDNVSRLQRLLLSCIGLRYRELPFGTRREEIESALSELHAEKYAESGTPAYEVNNEYFRMGRLKVRVCTEDEMLVSLWGSKTLVDFLYRSIASRSATRLRGGV